MTASEAARARLAFLLETVALEAEHLQATDERLFAEPFTAERAGSLRADALLAERLDAFAARFARLQDTAGDKLLPALLTRLGEPLGSVLDNLDRAGRLGLLPQASETWVAVRTLRNRMVHEYVRSPVVLAEAVNAAHEQVPMLVAFALAPNASGCVFGAGSEASCQALSVDAGRKLILRSGSSRGTKRRTAGRRLGCRWRV